MEDFSLKPIQTIKQSSSPNQFRIKSLSGGYNQPFLVSGQQIKTDLENSQRILSYALTTVDFAQSSEEIVMFLQSEVVAIQRQINELDRDQQIRSGIFGFKQGTALTIRKWLQSYKRSQESDLNKQIDFSNLMEQMKVASEKQCIFKLYRIVQALDMIITKQTENIAVLLLSLEDQAFFQTSPALTKIQTSKIIPFRLVNALMEKANMSLIKPSQQEQGVAMSLKKEQVQGQLKTIEDMIRFFDKIAINTSMNKEFKTYISSQLSELKRKDSLRETLLIKARQESDVAKEQINSLGLEKKQMKEEIAELKKQQQLQQQQIDQLTRNQGESLKELAEKYEKQIESLEKEHNQQIEELTDGIQAEMESQVREKVVGLSIRLEEQENEIKRLQTGQLSIQEQQKTRQAIDGKEKQKEEQAMQQNDKERITETINLLEEVKKGYEETIAKLRMENSEFKEKYQDMKAQNENIYQELLNLKQQLAAAQAEKDTITTSLSSKFMTKQEFCDTYENALREEFRRMKKSYEDKIEKLNKDVSSLKLEKHKALIDMKNMLDREQETKNLLMKKLSLFIKF